MFTRCGAFVTALPSLKLSLLKHIYWCATQFCTLIPNMQQKIGYISSFKSNSTKRGVLFFFLEAFVVRYSFLVG